MSNHYVDYTSACWCIVHGAIATQVAFAFRSGFPGSCVMKYPETQMFSFISLSLATTHRILIWRSFDFRPPRGSARGLCLPRQTNDTLDLRFYCWRKVRADRSWFQRTWWVCRSASQSVCYNRSFSEDAGEMSALDFVPIADLLTKVVAVLSIALPLQSFLVSM